MTTTTAFIVLFIFCQALGAFVGAASAVWGEIAYIRALRDGKIDAAERAHLRSIASGLRFGMVLLLLSSFGLVTVAYVLHVAEQPALSASYWILIALALLVTFVSWALSRGRISFALGSAAAFTGWWFLVFLTLGEIPPLSFGAAVAFFVVATGMFYALLQYARMLALHKS
ncbi:hypothetical protein KGQ72_00255 [Patescibacteria group bacterium]|nr:hypothetical protein [Patescibacteria group bacterium]